MWRGELDGAPVIGSQRREGYETVEIGNADLAQDLREQFDVPKPVSVDLATTIVPVVAVDLTDADGTAATEHPFIAATQRTPAAGSYAVSRIVNNGSGTVLVDRVRVRHNGAVRLELDTIQGINASASGTLGYLNTVPASGGAAVMDEQSAGGITDPYFGIAYVSATTFDEIALGVVLRAGESVSVYGSVAATLLEAVWFGTEFEA